MKILMFGWEFTPYISGGLGTACEGKYQALYKDIIPKQSGVQETLSYLVKVDYWDKNAVTYSIYDISRYPRLAKTVTQESMNEIKCLSWKVQ